MKEKELKIGDKLYELDYYHLAYDRFGREVTVFTITRVNPKTVSMKGYVWKIKRHEIGTKYFLSRQEMYENSIKLHKLERKKLHRATKKTSKEIRYLKNRIYWLKKNENK